MAEEIRDPAQIEAGGLFCVVPQARSLMHLAAPDSIGAIVDAKQRPDLQEGPPLVPYGRYNLVS